MCARVLEFRGSSWTRSRSLGTFKLEANANLAQLGVANLVLRKFVHAEAEWVLLIYTQ